MSGGPLTPRRVVISLVLAGVLLAIANAIYIEVAVPWPSAGVRLMHHANDAAEQITLGILVAGLVGGLFAVRPRLAFAGAALLGAVVAHVACGHSIWRRVMLTFDGSVEWSVYWPIVALAGLVYPALFLLGSWLGRFRRVFAVAPVAGVAALAINDALQPDQYFGDHCMIACGAAILACATLARRFEARLPAWTLRRAVSVAAPIVVFALWPPSNATRIELFKPPCAIGAWTFTTTLWRAPSTPASPPASTWLAGRSGDAPIAPTMPRLVDDVPVVVLVTVDATRADIVNADPPREPLPELTAMKSQGAFFTNALSPGSQTAISLSTLFSGRYFSQLHWELYGKGSRRFSYPAEDASPRFPELLTAAGVHTAMVGGALFLENRFGVARGFREQRMLVQNNEHAMGTDVVNALIDQMRAADASKPAFFYGHLLEPHHPYDRGTRKDGPALDRYVSEIALVDSLVARLARVTEERFGSRAILIVTSDHGEAFGEHGTVQHSKTVYGECLRVPLLVRGHGIAPRRIDQRVGLVDLGPTILDLFGVPTPASFMGQSLVPLLAGRPVALERPLFAEARLKRAILGDVKVIDDVRRQTIEVYDVKNDPGELDNLYGRDPRGDAALAALRLFFKDAPALYRP